MASRLFSPLQLRGVTLKNRIAVSPMCQYSCEGIQLAHAGRKASTARPW